MKLVTAVIARTPAAGDRRARRRRLSGNVVATAQARQEGGSILRYRGVEHRGQRCVRVEVLLDDPDLDAAVEVLKGLARGPTAVSPSGHPTSTS